MKVLLTAIILSITIRLILSDDDVASAFQEANLTPYPVIEAPKEIIEMNYPSKAVNLGTKFSPLELLKSPKIHYEHEEGAFYTLIMIGPSPFPERQVLHWLVSNIPGDEVSKGTVLAGYLPSIPILVYIGEHVYIFLVYKQNQGFMKFYTIDYFQGFITKRLNFAIKDFIEKYNLTDIRAGNFFGTQILDLPLL